MRLFLEISVGCLLAYEALQVALYVIPAFIRKQISALPEEPQNLPHFLVVAPCRDGAGLVSGIADAIKNQDYPKDRVHFLLLADNCIDGTVDMAQRLHVDVFARHDLSRQGKGYALNDLLEARLRQMPFDALVLFDIDARPRMDFLRQAARWINVKADVLQGSTIASNPDQSPMTKLGSWIQRLIRAHQRGRAALGWEPLMVGSHGIVINRKTLDQLDWILTTSISGDDIELGIRACLLQLRVAYVDELEVANEVPASGSAIGKQRRRWSRSSLHLAGSYGVKLLKGALHGNWRCLDILAGLLLSLSFSNLFLALSTTVVGSGIATVWTDRANLFLWISLGLWLIYFFYLLYMVRRFGVRVSLSDVGAVLKYLAVRLRASLESVLMLRSNDWWPTAHSESSSDKEKNVRH